MRVSALTGAAAALTALAVALSGCGSDKAEPSASSKTSAASSSSSATSSASNKPSPTNPEKSPVGPTVADYLNENGGAKVAKPAVDGAPTVDLPVPAGWEQFSDGLPEGAYGGIRYTGPESAAFQPTIFAYLQEVNPAIDVDRLFEVAPNELLGLPGYKPVNEGRRSELGGFPAYQLAGSYEQDGKETFIAQKIVVISGNDRVFLLQLNGYSLPDQQNILGPALDAIDAGTTITP